MTKYKITYTCNICGYVWEDEKDKSHACVNVLKEKNQKMETALKRIAKWFGEFPPSGHFYDDEKTRPMSYEAAFGSNGAREYMRNIAKEALRIENKTHGS